MKNIFKRFMNFIFIISVCIGLVGRYEQKELYLLEWIIGIFVFLGLFGGLNYVFFGKFQIWHKDS